MLRYLLILLAILLTLAIWYRAAAAAEGPILLYDEGHGQQFVAGGSGPLDLSEFSAILRGQGLVPRSHIGPFDDAALAGVSALIVSGPFVPFAEGEIVALRRFVEGGGTLVVMLHVGPPLAGLLHAFGVDFSNGVIRETADLLGDEPLNFRVTRLESHPLFAGLDAFTLYGGWALVNFDEGSRIIARTGPQAWIDLNGDRRANSGDAVQSFGVVVAGELGRGRLLVFGDDGLFQNRFLDEENRRLAANLGRWLVAGRP